MVCFYNVVYDKLESGVFVYYIVGVGMIFKKLGELEYLFVGKVFVWGYGWCCVWGYICFLNFIYKVVVGVDEMFIENDEVKDFSYVIVDGYWSFVIFFDKKY